MAEPVILDTADVAKDAVIELLQKQEEAAIKEIMHEKDEEVELTDSELLAVLNLHTDLTQKYASRPGIFPNYKSLSQEYRDRFEELGFIVQVDYILKGLAINPDAAPVEVSIIGRCNPIDRERQYDDVRRGVADSYYDKRRNQ